MNPEKKSGQNFKHIFETTTYIDMIHNQPNKKTLISFSNQKT